MIVKRNKGCRRLAGWFSGLCAALVLCACAGPARRAPKSFYTRADAIRRAGDLPAALAEARKGYTAWRNQPSSPWHWKFRLVTAEILLMRSEVKDALPLLQEDAPVEIAGRAAIQARISKDRGFAALIQSRWGDAVEQLTKAYDAAGRAGAADLFAEILICRGGARLRTGASQLAEADFREALAASKRAGDLYWQANALGSIGLLHLLRYQYDEAIDWSQRSLAISRREGYQGVTGKTIGNLGWCYFRLGDFERAGASFRETEAFMARIGRPLDRQIAIGHLGNLSFMDRDYKGALAQYRKALSIAEETQDRYYVAKWLDNIASTYIELKDTDAAEPHIARALALTAQSRESADRVAPLLLAASAALARNDYARAKQIYRDAVEINPAEPRIQWLMREGLGRFYSATGDSARAKKEFEAAVAVIDASWSRLLNDQSKLTFPSQLAALYQRYVDLLMEQGRSEAALAFVESRRARLLAAQTGAGAAVDFRAKARKLGAVLLSYWLAPECSYLWVTTAEQSRAFHLPGEPRIRELVDRYSRAIQDGRSHEAGRELYDVLIAPAQRLIQPGARVVIVADGALHSLNFETLVTEKGRYWIEDALIEVAPSLRLLNALPRRGAGRSILLIGNPSESDPALPKLPFAAEEVDRISRMFPERVVLTGSDARPEAYRASTPGKFSLIHFAAHAVANRESPLDSAVILSPGKDSAKLYAREVQRVPLDADLVTISGCRSSGARDYSGEGRVGLAWAFLSAGARSAIASLWDVSDESSAALMQALYARLKRNERPAEALRAAKLEFLRSGTAHQKPYYWAPFQIYLR